jgi:tetratricopeptide (TPR) repeat protein
MASLSYLGVLYAFLRAATAARPRPWQALALLALGLGFATKEIVATAPLVVWLFDALFLSGGPLAALRRRPGFYAALALLALGLVSLLVAPILLRGTTTAGLRFEEFGPLEYARTEAGVVLHYLRLAFWPHPLRFDYGWPIAHAPGDWLPESAAIAALLAATVVLCLRRSWVGFALASFFLVLAPTSSFVPILDPAFEHRMYLPLAAVLVLAAAGAGRLLGSGAARRLRAPLACAVALALAARTIRRNQDYRSEVELWRLTVAHAPEHARAHANLGSALLDAGRTQEAIAELLAALSLDTRDGYASLAVSPVAYLKLGHAYTRLQQPERALPFYRRAAELAEWPDSLEALATALAGQGDDAGAAVQLGKLLALRPHDAGAHARLAETLVRLGRAEEARTHFELAARLAPEREEAHVGLASLLVAQGEPSEALEHARRALAIEPDTAGEHFALGQALGALGRSEEAMAAFREAMRLAPELPAPCAAFARSVCMRPDASPELREEALRLASRAIELSGSTHAGFLEVGAMTHAALGDFARAARLLEQALELPDGGGLAGRLRAQREDYLRRAGG